MIDIKLFIPVFAMALKVKRLIAARHCEQNIFQKISQNHECSATRGD
jgi:hypothetical protein